MVICPIAQMVHCTGCILVKFCPAKTILGDYGKIEGDEKEIAEKKQTNDRRSVESPTEEQ